MILFVISFIAIFVGICYILGGVNIDIPEEFDNFSEVNNAKYASESKEALITNII